MMAPLFAGAFVLARLAQRAEPASSAEALLPQLTDRLGLRRRVTVLQTSERMMPMAWGILRANVLLPAESADWSARRMSVVLLHELAHVKRRDAAAQWIAQLARALYWFNPLAWLATRQLAVERERACDDLVLSQGARASDYAEELLSVATGFIAPALPCAAGLAMARSSKLEGRLRAILDATRNRRIATRRAASLSALLLAAALLPLAALHTRAAAADATPSAPPVADQPATMPAAHAATDSDFLNMNIATVDFDNAPLPKVLDFLHDLTGANIVLETHVLEGRGVDPQSPVTLHLHNVPFSKVLSLTLAVATAQQPLAYFYDRGVITVSTREQIDIEQSEVPDTGETTSATAAMSDALRQASKAEQQQADALRQRMDQLKDELDSKAIDFNTPFLDDRANLNNSVENTSGPRATLYDGTTIELLGLNTYPPDNRFWWKPDASPLNLTAPPATIKAQLPPGKMGRQLLARIVTPYANAQDLDSAWQFRTHGGAAECLASLTMSGPADTTTLAVAALPSDAKGSYAPHRRRRRRMAPRRRSDQSHIRRRHHQPRPSKSRRRRLRSRPRIRRHVIRHGRLHHSQCGSPHRRRD